MQSDPVSPSLPHEKPNGNSCPALAVTLSTEGAVTTEDTGPGGLTPRWTVRFTITYLDTPHTHQEPIIFLKPRLSDHGKYQLRYLLDGQWHDAEPGIGCMMGMDLKETELHVVDSRARFVSLHPGEAWETALSVFQLDWECPDEDGAAYAGEVFQLQYLGESVQWWDYGRHDDHKETVVTVDAFGRVLSPTDNAGRGNLVFQRSNVLEARWCKPPRSGVGTQY
ncbi:hypothetical protein BJX61DRAFT_12033 [Aspergillus egyptiacus]|nr:hypothetical protein BJX61DRAFT_12033 [Aspergillus egyptiacus]